MSWDVMAKNCTPFASPFPSLTLPAPPTKHRSGDLALKRAIFAIPGKLDTPTGGYIYDRMVIEGLRGVGWHIDVVGLGDGFPSPAESTRQRALDLLTSLPHPCPVIIDGLAYGVLPEARKHLHPANAIIALVHHPLALETGVNPQQAHLLRASEILALSSAAQVIVTSPSTGRELTEHYGVDPECLTVICPGTDRARQYARMSTRGTVRLLSVGAIVPRKGFISLVRALRPLAHLDWDLVIVGDPTRSIETSRELEQVIHEAGLTNRIRMLGTQTIQELEQHYAASDVFVLASEHEGYGMAYAEAIAHGLPVIGTRAGAIPETVPQEAGILVEPGNLDELTRALETLITDLPTRQLLASGARQIASRLPTWTDATLQFEKVLDRVNRPA